MSFNDSNSSTSNSTTMEESVVSRPDDLNDVEQAIAIVLYTMVSLTAIGGNGIVLFVILRFRRLRTPTNLLIANLALADLSMAVTCIPFSYWPFLILGYWPFGKVMCKLLFFCQAVTVMCSAYTLVAISIDRFVAVMFPMRRSLKLTRVKAVLCIVFVWILSGIIACPLLFVLKLVDTDEGVQCQEVWPNPDQETTFGVALMILQYFVPLMVLILTYTGIGLKIWHSRVPGEGNRDLNKSRQDSVRKLIPTMLIVTSVFAICWLPQNLLLTLAPLSPSISDYKHILRVWWGCHLLAMSHSFINPIIYVARNERFRVGFFFALKCLPCIKYDGSLHMDSKSIISGVSTTKKSTLKKISLNNDKRIRSIDKTHRNSDNPSTYYHTNGETSIGDAV